MSRLADSPSCKWSECLSNVGSLPNIYCPFHRELRMAMVGDTNYKSMRFESHRASFEPVEAVITIMFGDKEWGGTKKFRGVITGIYHKMIQGIVVGTGIEFESSETKIRRFNDSQIVTITPC